MRILDLLRLKRSSPGPTSGPASDSTTRATRTGNLEATLLGESLNFFETNVRDPVNGDTWLAWGLRAGDEGKSDSAAPLEEPGARTTTVMICTEGPRWREDDPRVQWILSWLQERRLIVGRRRVITLGNVAIIFPVHQTPQEYEGALARLATLGVRPNPRKMTQYDVIGYRSVVSCRVTISQDDGQSSDEQLPAIAWSKQNAASDAQQRSALNAKSVAPLARPGDQTTTVMICTEGAPLREEDPMVQRILACSQVRELIVGRLRVITLGNVAIRSAQTVQEKFVQAAANLVVHGVRPDPGRMEQYDATDPATGIVYQVTISPNDHQ